jgi:hypothetical protein
MLRELLETITARRRLRRARLPWRELEAEAARQGCSPADIFFDWARQPVADSNVRPPEQRPVDDVSSDPARPAAT